MTIQMRTSLTNHILVFVFTALSMLTANSAQAQNVTSETPKKKIPVEIRLGFTSACFDTPYDNQTKPSSSKAGIYVGLVSEYRLSDYIYFKPGLVLTSKGGKLDADYEGDKAITINATYLQVPAYFSLKVPLRKYRNSFNVNMGPYFAYGIFGKTFYKPSGSSASVSYDTFGSQGVVNRIDAGLGFEVQFELKEKIVFTLGSEVGMIRSMKQGLVNTDKLVGNSTAYLSVGYRFQ